MNCDLVHLYGILDRDQRTVRCRQHHHHHLHCRHYHNSTTTATTTSSCVNQQHQSDISLPKKQQVHQQQEVITECWICRRTRKNRPTWRIVQRLKRVLVLSVYLLTIEYLPVTWSAPMQNSNSRTMAERMQQHPKWINPCGAMAQNDMGQEVPDAIILSDRELLEQIVLTARIALTEAENFREEYVQKTFSIDFKQHHLLWKSQRYDWLPSRDQIPKELGEMTPMKHLETLELDKSLLDTYEYLQTIAVGLEQLVWDQKDEEAPFAANFESTEQRLNALLCEIQVALLERRVTTRPDVRRDIMTEMYRTTDNMSARYLRDWLIFRDLMNALEYTIQVFKYHEDNL